MEKQETTLQDSVLQILIQWKQVMVLLWQNEGLKTQDEQLKTDFKELKAENDGLKKDFVKQKTENEELKK